jgi:hypothetical protein
VFVAVPTVPRLKAQSEVPHKISFLTCRGEKYLELCTGYINGINVGLLVSQAQNPYIGWWPRMHGANSCPLQSHAASQLPDLA